MKNIIYMYSNLDRNNKLLIIIIIVIVALLVLIGLYNLISSIVAKAKYRKNNKKLVDEQINKEYKEQEVKAVVEEVKPIEQPVIHETKEEIIENYQKTVKEEMEEIETLDETVTDLDEILVEMMNVGSGEEFDLTDFEREQEENAIISYEELCKKAGVEQIIYPKKEINKEVADKIEKEVYSTPFRPSTVISPIYGVQKEESPKDEDENDFLGRLKEFRSGL
jgi:FtsZ-interacting cell division protein ZipA